MRRKARIRTAQISMRSDHDGRHAARIVALSMGILFGLIFALHALSYS